MKFASQKKPGPKLISSLSQLIQDCFDEEQYDQAVDLLQQLLVTHIRPKQDHIRNLFALCLCSIPLDGFASSSKLTLDDDEFWLRTGNHVRSSVQSNHRLDMSKLTSEKPSFNAITGAYHLLCRLVQSDLPQQPLLHPQPILHDSVQFVSVASYILNCLPSVRQSVARGNTSASKSTDQEDDEQIHRGPISHWVEHRMSKYINVWDLLTSARTADSEQSELLEKQHVDEFWISFKEQKQVQNLIQAKQTRKEDEELERRIVQKKRTKKDDVSDTSSDPSETSESEDKEDVRPPIHNTRSTKLRGRTNRSKMGGTRSSVKRSRKTGGAYSATQLSQKVKKKRRREPIEMTEGAWRTLEVLVQLWKAEAQTGDNPTGLIDQFPLSGHAKAMLDSPWRNAALKGQMDGSLPVKDVGKALDVVFSFPQIIQATWRQEGAEDLINDFVENSDEFDLNNLEVVKRLEVATSEDARNVAKRAQVAADLLSEMFALVQAGKIDLDSMVAGTADRFSFLTTRDADLLCILLLQRQPAMLALSLIRYVSVSSPVKAESQGCVSLEGGGFSISIHPYFAYSLPSKAGKSETVKTIGPSDKEFSKVLDKLAELNQETLQEMEDLFPLQESPDRSPVNSVSTSTSTSRIASTEPNLFVEIRPIHTEMEVYRVQAYLRLREMMARERISHLKWYTLRALVDIVDSQPQDDARKQDNRSVVETQLKRLSKALQRDQKVYEKCTSSMMEYYESTERFAVSFSERSEDGRNEVELMSVKSVADRCNKLMERTRHLEHACKVLLDQLREKECQNKGE